MSHNDLLIFKDFCGEFVVCQEYIGRTPPQVNTIPLYDSEYKLSIVGYDDKEYLVAHNQRLDKDAVEDAIRHYNPKPIK